MGTTFMYIEKEPEDTVALMPAIRAAGVDVLMNYKVAYATDNARILTYLDACAANDLRACISLHYYCVTASSVDTVGITNKIDALKAHPAIYGWYVKDDATATTFPLANRRIVYSTVKAADPTRKVVGGFWSVTADSAYEAGTQDVVWLYTGTTGNYCYFYDKDAWANAPYYGCVAYLTDTLTSASKEASMLVSWGSRLTTEKNALVAAGQSEYGLAMQAFGHTAEGYAAGGPYGMPPSGGITKLWNAALARGYDDGGSVGFFLWTAVTPYLWGVGDGYPNQVAEITAINATFANDAEFACAVSFAASGHKVTTAVSVTTNSYWRQYGDIITVRAPIGTRVATTATVTANVSGSVIFDGAQSSRFEISTDGGSTWSASGSVSAGSNSVLLGCTAQSGDTSLSARIGVPT